MTVRFILGVLSAWQMNPAFRCNPMCWLITINCSSTMGFSLSLGCPSFWVPWCLVSEAPHSGAIPCAMAGQNFHQYNPVYNCPFSTMTFL